MSSISTDLSMNDMKFFTENEITMCSIYNLKMLIFIITICILIWCLTSCIKTIMYDENNECGCKIEHFGNDELFSYKNIDYTSYQSAQLTPVGESLIFGQANRFIQPDMYILDVYCNLYILNGNIFGSDINDTNKTINQKYLVYIIKDKSRKFVGQLQSGSDQVYKLHFTTDKVKDYASFNELDIVYLGPDQKETTIIKGTFI